MGRTSTRNANTNFTFQGRATARGSSQRLCTTPSHGSLPSANMAAKYECGILRNVSTSYREASFDKKSSLSCKIWLRYSRERALQSLADRRDPKFFVARRSCHLSLRRPRPGTPRWSRLWRSYGSISPCLGGKSTGTSFTNLYISTKSRSLCNFQISDTSA